MQLLLALALTAAAQDLPPELKRSVVKIFTTYQRPNFYQPWQMIQQESLTGSGAVIEGGRILTNAHVVSNHTYVQVRKAGDPEKYTARVEFVGHDTELAVLRVDDPDFHKDVRPLPLGQLPRQRQRLAVYGFPTGGDELSITEGTVSRLEVTRYTHSGSYLLTVQTDAAINPGNSGGPALIDGALVGVSFQSYSGSGVENVGYTVPVTLVRRFLKDIADGRYDGTPHLGIQTNKMENAALRKRYGLAENKSGTLVAHVFLGASTGILQAGDVITAIDGHPVGNDRTYAVENGARLEFSHLVSMHQAGEKVRVDVLREGKPLSVQVPVRPFQELVAGPLYDVKPSYFVFSGMVFTPLTRNYVNLWEPKDQATTHKYLVEFGLKTPERHEAVVLAYVFSHDVTAGYTDMRGQIIQKINGKTINRLSDVVEAFKKPQDGYHVIEPDNETEFGLKLVLDAAKAQAANAEILKLYGVPADRSPDLAADGLTDKP